MPAEAPPLAVSQPGMLACTDAGKGAAVVLIHGVGLDMRVWGPQVAPLVAADLRVIRVNLPGHGGTDGREGMDLDSYAAFVLDQMDRLGVARATLIGAALGGFVARRMAVLAPERVTALVLISQIARRSPEAGAAIMSRWQDCAQRGAAAILAPAMARWLSPGAAAPTVALVADMVDRTAPAAFLDSYHAFATSDGALAEEAARITCPCLVIAGADDAHSGPSQAAALCALLPDAQTETIPRAKHLVSLDAPEALTGSLLRFLTRSGTNQQKPICSDRE